MKNKSYWYLASVSLALSLQFGISAALPALAGLLDRNELKSSTAETLIAQRRSRLRFKVPNVRASGNLRGGAARGQCNMAGESISITPLLPSKPSGKIVNGRPEIEVFPANTLVARPKFFVHIPQTTAQEVNFLLLEQVSESQEKLVYEENFAIADTPGVASFSLPADSPGLEVGKTYKWSVEVICDASADNSGNPSVGGVVKRIAPPSELANLEAMPMRDRPYILSENDVWYDAVAALAELRLNNQSDATLATDWSDLLSSVNLDAISDAPVVPCCKPN